MQEQTENPDREIIRIGDIIDIRQRQVLIIKAKLNGVTGEFIRPFFTDEPFFFSTGYKQAVLDKRCRSISSYIDAQNVHEEN